MKSPETGRAVEVLLVEDDPGDIELTKEAIEKARLTLGWMGVFHYTTESIVNRFLDIQARGLMPRLERLRDGGANSACCTDDQNLHGPLPFLPVAR